MVLDPVRLDSNMVGYLRSGKVAESQILLATFVVTLVPYLAKEDSSELPNFISKPDSPNPEKGLNEARFEPCVSITRARMFLTAAIRSGTMTG